MEVAEHIGHWYGASVESEVYTAPTIAQEKQKDCTCYGIRTCDECTCEARHTPADTVRCAICKSIISKALALHWMGYHNEADEWHCIKCAKRPADINADEEAARDAAQSEQRSVDDDGCCTKCERPIGGCHCE